MKRILLRADGGVKTGYGHWSRCFNLLENINDVEVILFTKYAEQIPQTLLSAFITVKAITSEEEFLNSVTQRDIVVVDHYDYNPTLFNALRQKDALTVIVDDFVHKAVDCDVVINHTPGFSPQMYSFINPCTCYYLGTQYNLISPIFKADVIKDEARLDNVLVNMGGADPENYTRDILNRLKGLKKNIYVVIGDAYQHADALFEMVKDSALHNVAIKKGVNKSEMANLMNKCGIAVLSASTISMEYASIGGILFIQQTAGNQQFLYKGLLDEKIALEVTGWQEILQRREEMVYQECLESQKEAFDGKAPQRFKKLFGELFLQKEIQFRRAIIADTDTTYNWAKSDVIRKYAYSRNEIKFEEHQNWFTRKIEQGNCIYYIVLNKGSSVGSLRIDINENVATISYLIDESWHGKGFGRIVLAEGLKSAMREDAFRKVTMVLGYVMKQNVASVKVFERLGFIKEDAEEYTDSFKFYKKVKTSYENR